ncbi:MAG: ribonuclease HII [Alphaproteobacteria bacterium]|nr:ribonuclease HII [Alphaproteobacteria bacterium]
MPDFSFEQEAYETLKYKGFIAGVDEAGCGPWAGPVVAGAVVFLNFKTVPVDLLSLVDDSKKLTAKRREKAYNLLKAYEGIHCYIGCGQTSEGEIDRINIRQRALLAMARAVENLPQQPDFALVDGICAPSLNCPLQTLKKGDGRSFSIAAASIIAKVTRDTLMKDLALRYPHYGWETNAGYGTKTHQEGLLRHGVTPHHRRSFAPVAKLYKNEKGQPENLQKKRIA